MVIILGNKYNFTDKEKNKLNSTYNKVVFLSYKNRNNTIKILKKYFKKNRLNTIVLNTKAKLPNSLIKYLTKLEGNGTIYIEVEDFLEKNFNKCYIDDDSSNVSYFTKIKSLNRFQIFQKAILDYIMVTLTIPIFIITYIITYFKIKKESPGKIIYKQKRVTKANKEFICTKIRTMHTDAEKNGPCFADDCDPRAYPWGAFLRDSKLDELGQLINILKGEMHFVGPRPERPIWVSQFEKEIPYYNLRHLVKPGITGLAQIEYQYGKGTLDAKEKLMYDLYYIKYWSIWLDIKIIFKTIVFLIKKASNS